MDVSRSSTASSPVPPPARSALLTAWPPSAQLTTAFLLGASAALLIAYSFNSWRGGSRPTQLEQRLSQSQQVEPARPHTGQFTSTSVSKTAGRKEASLREPIDLNEASAEELQRLPGIGPKRSQQIIDERQKKLFRNVDDLRRVTGIGPKTLVKLRPFVTVKGEAIGVAAKE